MIRPGTRPWYDYHFHHWHRGYWNWWRPRNWFIGGVATGWMLGPRPATFVFNNPFYDQSSVTVINYSQPLPAPPEDAASEPEAMDTADAAIAIFDQAREAFKNGDFKEALALVDKSIEQLPTDATLHEFRALCLFAIKEYKQAAATLYAMLAAGPGWDWDTMRSLYPDVATYTEKLRALEAYQRANPKSPEANFVLGYHYLVMGHLDVAIKKFENVVKLLPDSELSAELLNALKVESNRPMPQAD